MKGTVDKKKKVEKLITQAAKEGDSDLFLDIIKKTEKSVLLHLINYYKDGKVLTTFFLNVYRNLEGSKSNRKPYDSEKFIEIAYLLEKLDQYALNKLVHVRRAVYTEFGKQSEQYLNKLRIDAKKADIQIYNETHNQKFMVTEAGNLIEITTKEQNVTKPSSSINSNINNSLQKTLTELLYDTEEDAPNLTVKDEPGMPSLLDVSVSPTKAPASTNSPDKPVSPLILTYSPEVGMKRTREKEQNKNSSDDETDKNINSESNKKFKSENSPEQSSNQEDGTSTKEHNENEAQQEPENTTKDSKSAPTQSLSNDKSEDEVINLVNKTQQPTDKKHSDDLTEVYLNKSDSENPLKAMIESLKAKMEDAVGLEKTYYSHVIEDLEAQLKSSTNSVTDKLEFLNKSLEERASEDFVHNKESYKLDTDPEAKVSASDYYNGIQEEKPQQDTVLDSEALNKLVTPDLSLSSLPTSLSKNIDTTDESSITKTINNYIQSTVEYESSVYNSIYSYIPDTSTTLMLLGLAVISVGVISGIGAIAGGTIGVGEVGMAKVLDCSAGIAYEMGSHLVEGSFDILQTLIATSAA